MKQIPLTAGKVALIDDEDFDLVSQYYCCYDPKGYALCKKYMGKVGKVSKWKVYRMHRLILGFPEGMSVDHINHDTLDNRKINLRICTHAQNMKNQTSQVGSSIYKGVCFNKEQKKWRAAITASGKRVYLGDFKTQEAAAIAYNKAAAELHGEFACLNKVAS
jgi:hypothetical protein